MEETKYQKRTVLPLRHAVTCSIVAMLMFFNSQKGNAQTTVASNSGPVCTGGTVMLYETGGSAVSWLWSSSGAAVFNDRSLQNPVVTGAVDGNGSVDTGDYSIMVNNANRYVRTIHP